jgi:hypothetical protein
LRRRGVPTTGKKLSTGSRSQALANSFVFGGASSLAMSGRKIFLKKYFSRLTPAAISN